MTKKFKLNPQCADDLTEPQKKEIRRLYIDEKKSIVRVANKLLMPELVVGKWLRSNKLTRTPQQIARRSYFRLQNEANFQSIQALKKV